MLPRQIGSRSHQHRELVVADRAFEQHAKAGMGDARRGVPRHRVGDLLIAARHQDVGDRLAEVLVLRYRQQMLLALAVGVVHQVRLFQTFGGAQQRTRHLDIVSTRCASSLLASARSRSSISEIVVVIVARH
jgi:hypothetical protein